MDQFLGGGISFTVSSSGSQCMQFDQQAYGFTVTTSAGAVTLSEDQGQTTLTVTCGGATTAGPIAGLKSCSQSAPGSSEGCSCSSQPNDAGVYNGSFAFTLDGTSGPNGSTPIFSCQSP